MPFRFRKTFAVAKGVNLNLTHRGPSVSVGVPGTGVYWTSRGARKKAAGRAASVTAPPARRTSPVLLGFLLLVLGGLALALHGCGGSAAAKFDATNDATVKASVNRMSEGLSKEEKVVFMRSYLTLVMPSARSASTEGQGVKSLDGLTVAEINAKAAEARAAGKR